MYSFLQSMDMVTNTNARTCPEVQPWLYGYDAMQEVENAVAANPRIFGANAELPNAGQKVCSWASISSYLPLYLPVLLFGIGKLVL